MQDGLTWQDRWYVDGELDENLGPPREPWNGGASGTWTVSISDPARLRPGTYRVELYVEGQLVQAGETTLGQGLMASTMMTPMTSYTSGPLGLSLARPRQWRLVGGGATHEFVAFAARRDMAFFIVTTRRYEAASPSEANARALKEGLASQREMHDNLERVGDTRTITVAGRQGRAVDYAFSDGEKQLRGVAIVVTTEAGLTYRIRFEALADAFETQRPTFDAMLNSLSFVTGSG